MKKETSKRPPSVPRERRQLPWHLSRRSFMKAGLGGAAVLGLHNTDCTVDSAHADDEVSDFKKKSPVKARLAGDAILKLVNRVSQGFTLSEYQQARKLGYDAYLEYQLAYEKIDDSDVEKRLANHHLLRMTPKQLRTWYFDPLNKSKRNTLFTQLDEMTIVRRVFSRRQLYERMVEFWSDHFNIDVIDGACRYLYPAWNRDVIRKHAMGNFFTLLSETAHHGCMSDYLDNNTNRVGQQQENYAREIMELHTLGVDNGYTQQDVIEVARCLTGWNYWGSGNTNYGDFRYISSWHDNGTKTVLNHVIPANGGIKDGETVLNILSWHPNTAGYIARKLAHYFLGYQVAQSVVDSVARTYMITGGDIRSMLRTLLDESNMTVHATPKLKRPAHYVVSLLRALGGEVVAPGGVSNQIGSSLVVMGHQPHRWPTPDGYPDSLEAWGQALLPRWTFASDLNDQRLRWASIDPVRAISQVAGGLGAGRQASAINQILSGGQLPEEEMLMLQMFIDQNGPTTQTFRDAISVAASLPGFQWY